jgi:nucleoside 2-deoxyribosyltransferase
MSEKVCRKKARRKIYLASSWKNAENVRYLARLLRSLGHEVFDFSDAENRLDGFDKFVFGAKQWAEFSGKKPDEIEYKDFLTWTPTQRAFKSDRAGLDWADTVVLLLPSGRSSHLEAGYGVGKGKELFILGDLPFGEFDAMYSFAKACFHMNELGALLEKLSDCGYKESA